MSHRLRDLLASLLQCDITKDNRRSSELLSNIIQYFDDELLDAEIDVAIELTLDKTNGALAFLQLSLTRNKVFKDTNAEMLDFFKVLIQRYPTKIAGPKVGAISDAAISCILSQSVSAKEKERAANVLKELVEMKLCSEINLGELAEGLLGVANIRNCPGRLLQKCCELLGLICSEHPTAVNGELSDNIRFLFFEILERVLIAREKISFESLAGAMQGLNYFLNNFAPSVDAEPEMCQRIYDCVKRLSEAVEGRNRAPYQNAITLFAQHTTIIQSQIYTEHMFWQEILQKWLTSNEENRKIGSPAVYSFHKHLSQSCATHQDTNTLKYYINQLTTILRQSTAEIYEQMIAIRGLGLMAPACKSTLPDNAQYLSTLLTLAIERMEYFYGDDYTVVNQPNLKYIPDFVQAVSHIMQAIEQIDAPQIEALQNILIGLCKNFCYIHRTYHAVIMKTLHETLINLHKLGGNVLMCVLEKVIYVGIIFTCSHKATFVAPDFVAGEKYEVSYKKFVPLWEGLLDVTKTSSKSIIPEVFDQLIGNLFKILQKLDLRVVRNAENDVNNVTLPEPSEIRLSLDLTPIKPYDFNIFFNLIRLYQELFNVKKVSSYFLKWINIYFENIMILCAKFPLISGFLKLMEIGFQLINELEYFERDHYSEMIILRSSIDDFLTTSILNCQQTFGELQLSYLRVICAAPSTFLQQHILDLVPVFQIGLQLGTKLFWVAHLAITALEKMFPLNVRNLNELNRFYQQVLPIFDLYLQSDGSLDDNRIQITIRNRQVYRKYKIAYNENNRTTLQKRILKFLGTLEPQMCLHLIRPPPMHNLELTEWTTDKTIGITLDSSEYRSELFFDSMIPRIIQCASKSSDRRTRLAACEFVHAATVFVLAKEDCDKRLVTELVQTALLLGCDEDEVARQIFEPFLIQIMHFITKNTKVASDLADIVVDCVMEAIAHRSNTAMRNLGSKLLKEFVEWTIKNKRMQHLDVSPVNVRLIIDRLRAYSSDSATEKRAGAAIAFNNMYAILREEFSIIDMYWIDLLHTFCNNFKLSEEHGSTNVNLGEISVALDHVVRVLIERADIFNRLNENRVKPFKFINATLLGASIFLFNEFGCKQMNYRRKCISLFGKLAPLTPEFDGTIVEFLNTIKCNVMVVFESELRKYPNLSHIGMSKDSPTLLINNFLEEVLKSLDCYTFLAYISPQSEEDLNPIFENTIIFKIISYFLNNICWQSIDEILNIARNDVSTTGTSVATLDQALEIRLARRTQQIKCEIMLQIIIFLTKMMQHNKIPAEFFYADSPVIELVRNLLFLPKTMGFDLTDQELFTRIPQEIEKLLQAIPTTLNKPFVNAIHTNMRSRLQTIIDALDEVMQENMVTITRINSTEAIKLAYFLCSQFDADFHFNAYIKTTLELIQRTIFAGLKVNSNGGVQQARRFDPDVKKFLNTLMSICLQQQIHVNMILNVDVLKSKSGNTEILYGQLFFDTFKRPILKQLLQTSHESVATMVELMLQDNFCHSLRVLTELTEYAFKLNMETNSLTNLIESILSHFPELLEKSIQFTCHSSLLLTFMSYVAMASPFPLHQFKEKTSKFGDWILGIISNPELSLKTKGQAIFLLPCITGPDDTSNEAVATSLAELQSKHYPIKSKEFLSNSLEQLALIASVDGVLDALLASQSPVLLRFIITATSGDDEHICEPKIRATLEKLMENSLHGKLLQIPYEMFCDESLEPRLRLLILQRFLLTMLRNCSVDVVEHFFGTNIRLINKLMDTKLTGFESEFTTEQALTSKIGGYQLVEVMFATISKDRLHNPQSPIGINMLGEDNFKIGTEVTREMCKSAFKARQDIFVAKGSVTKELFRKYHCAVFNAMCTVICNTQNELKYYSMLFMEKPEKGVFLWKNLVQLEENVYDDLNQELDEIYTKQSVASIRLIQPVVGIKRFETQSIFASSFSQDVSKIDLNTSTIRSGHYVDGGVDHPPPISSLAVIPLEKNRINEHEVMTNLCAVINHIGDNLPTSAQAAAPAWLTELIKVIENTTQPRNVRLFLCKLIDNCRRVFKIHAKTVAGPVLRLLADECVRGKLNTLHVDLTVMLLEWNDQYKPVDVTDILSATSVLQFFVENSTHERHDIFKHNLEVIRTMVSLWKQCFQPPRQLIFNFLQSSDDNKTIAGFYYAQIFISNDLHPWTDTTRLMFFKLLVQGCNHADRKIYRIAAQMMGVFLNHFDLECDEFKDFIQKMRSIRMKRTHEDDKKFLDLLYGIQTGFPKIITTFQEGVIYYAMTCSGAQRKMVLEMFLSGIDDIGANVYREMSVIGIKDLLNVTEYQVISLHIINKAIPLMKINDIDDMLPSLLALLTSKRIECREIVYEVLIYISNNEELLVSKVRPYLFEGIRDANEKIRNRLFEFWKDVLPKQMDQRFIELLTHCYNPNREASFLSNCMQLMLEIEVQHPTANEIIFKNLANDEHKRKEYEINVDWRQRNSLVMSPLFSQGRLGRNQGTNYNILDGDLMFEPTQNPIRRVDDILTLQSSGNFLLTAHTQFDRRSQRIFAKSQSNPGQINANFDNLRKRFLTEKQNVRAPYVAGPKKTDATIKLFRRYRIGDHPDLYINKLALLMPLQCLLSADSVLARHVFVAMFQSLHRKQPVALDFMLPVAESVAAIFKQTKKYDTTLFGALLEVALIHPSKFKLNIPIEQIGLITKACNLTNLGILYLETQVDAYILNSEEGSRSSKSTPSSLSDDTKYWLKLSDMYWNLYEADVVSGIFSDKLRTDERLPKAIQCESHGNFVGAIKLYSQLLDGTLEDDFSYKRVYRCFEAMGNWKDLSSTVNRQITTFGELWTDTWNQENILPLLMKSEMYLSLNGANSVEFFNHLKVWLSDEDKSEYLQLNCGEILMMMYLANLDSIKIARVHAERYFACSLIEWSHLNVLVEKLRADKLTSIHRVAEMSNYVDLLMGEEISKQDLIVLGKRWMNSLPNTSEAIVLWEWVASRNFIKKKIVDKCGGIPALKPHLQELDRSMLQLNLKVLDTALEQGNVYLADAILRTRKSVDQNGDELMNWNIRKWKQQRLKALIKTGEAKLNGLLAAWKGISDMLQQAIEPKNVDSQLLALNEMGTIVEEIFKLTETINFDESAIVIIYELVSSDRDNANLKECLFSTVLDYLKSAVELNAHTLDIKVLGDSHFRLAQFSYEHLGDEQIEATSQMEHTIIQSVFSGMLYESWEARQMFPCLLQLPNLLQSNELQVEFNALISEVPRWMFLKWLPQIISAFDFKQAGIMDLILLRIAEAYPNALCYDFLLAYTQFKTSFPNATDRRVVANINEKLQNPIRDKFIEQMASVCVPWNFLDNLITFFNRSSTTPNQFAVRYEEFLAFISNEETRGRAFDVFKQFEASLKDIGVKIRELGVDTDNFRKERIKELLLIQHKFPNQRPSKEELRHFSPWLADYKWCGEENYIEVPGQYLTDKRPNVRNHVKIIGFSNQLTIFKTLRKPIKIQVNGNNGKNYSFLVKAGDDLRQDRRVQQMLELMSAQLRLDNTCRSQELFVNTYAVVPLTATSGILSWVHDTAPIQDVVRDKLNKMHRDDETSGDDVLRQLSEQYYDFMSKAGGVGSGGSGVDDFMLFSGVVTNCTRERIINNFYELQNKLNVDLLRSAIVDLSSSPESFFVLRNNFAASLAAMNLSHWILGIGDRNLGNILLNKRTGHLIGIDFGFAFGAAITCQRIPELFPFRLTPQFVNALTPLGTTGLITKGMTNALKCYRNSKKLLTACLKTFIEEPNIDWLPDGDKKQQVVEIMAKQRITIFSRKLDGWNPMELIKADLNYITVVTHKPTLLKVKELLAGVERFNIRARLGENGLTVEQQIECLLDLATDPAILGICFYGMQPWI